MTGGVSIMDLGLNEFRLDLLDYMKTHNDIEHAPYGMHAVVQAKGSNIYIKKQGKRYKHTGQKQASPILYGIYFRGRLTFI